MFGLILSDPENNAALRCHAAALLNEQQIPFSGWTDRPARHFPAQDIDRNIFLRRAAWALLQPGEPLPLRSVVMHLSGDALPGNVLRRYVCLQLSLLPYLRPGRQVVSGQGCFLVGDSLLVVPVDEQDCTDAILPTGQWTDLQDGTVYENHLRLMRGYNAMPVLVRENTLLPIGVNDRSACHDDADRVTLHWYQPGKSARCVLADGSLYEAVLENGTPQLRTDCRQTWHFIVHRDGNEWLIR